MPARPALRAPVHGPLLPDRRGRPALGALLALLVVGGCGGGEPSAPARGARGARPVAVGVRTLAPEVLTQRVEGTGSLEAYQVVTVAARIDGVVESVAFDEGDTVDPRRDLAVVDGTRRALESAQAAAAVKEAEALAPRALATVARARAGVERARAQQGAAATDRDEALAMVKRREDLRAERPGVVPEEELATLRAQAERRRDAVNVAAAALAEAEAALAEAEAGVTVAAESLRSAQARAALAAKSLADTVVRAPLAGVVRRRHVTLGQYVRAGDPLAEIVDRTRLRVRFRVTEAESVRLAAGQALTFTVPSLGAQVHEGALVHVDETAHPVSRMVECLGEVARPAPFLKPGFFVMAGVDVATAAALVVPEGALRPSEQGWVVFVVQDGRAERRPVRLGLRTKDGRVEVAEGLAAGQAVIVEGANVVSAGTPVEVRAPAPPPGASSSPSATGAAPAGSR